MGFRFVTNVVAVNTYEVWYLLPDMDQPYLKLLHFIPPEHPHFPYGENVEPDAPL